MDIFDIIGPIMIGPSSSHTAGAVKIGNIARGIFGGKIESAVIHLYNSFADTGKGHGTDVALVGGLLGMSVDDERIVNSCEIAKQSGVDMRLVWEKGLNTSFEPNSAVIEMYGGGKSMAVTAVSLGGGRVMASNIDGYDTALHCEHDTLITIHSDVVGVVAKVSAVLADYGVNIAFIKLHRKHKGEEMMVVETDDPICDEILTKVASFDEVRKASLVKKIG